MNHRLLWHLSAAIHCQVFCLALALALPARPATPPEEGAYPVRTVAPGLLQVGRLPAAIDESSGLVASRKYQDTLWTHNDKGNQPVLFAVTRQGRLLSEFGVSGATLIDWEDLAVDDQGMLYLADTGNNKVKRMKLAVHRLPEPDPKVRKGSVEIRQTWNLIFPGEPFDSESLFIQGGFGYLITKVTKDQSAEIYRFALRQSNDLAALEWICRLPVTSPVAGADLSPDGALLGLVCKSGAFVFKLDGEVARAGTVTPVRTKYKFDGIEGCSFVSDGMLATAESREIFLFNAPAFRWLGP